MRRILSLILVISVILGTALPISAFAAGSDSMAAVGESGDVSTPTSADNMAAGESGTTEPATDGGETTAPTDGVTVIQPEDCAEPAATASGAALGFAPLSSGFEDGGAAFYTKIRLTVMDRNGNPVSGAVYGLYRADDDQLVETLTSDSYGVATSGDVPVETDYYLLEHTAPQGFSPNAERYDILLAELCAPSRVDVTAVYDPIMGQIKVIKTDEYGSPMQGIGFYVYRSATGEMADTIYTDGSGEAVTSMLPYGMYELYEFDYPSDMAGGEYTSVMVEYDGETHEVYITNYRAYGNVTVYKTGADGRKIQGAVFSVYQADGSWIEDITTSSGGYAYSGSLPLGGYYLTEQSVPEPYELDETRHDFSISYNGDSPYFSLVNDIAGENGTVRVIKTDDSANPLSGVVFGVYRSWDGGKITELTTGQDGTAEYSLIPGDYYLSELSGKTGYTMESGQIAFTVDGGGETVELTVVNPKERIFGKVQVLKQDDAGSPIPGVRLGVYCHSDNLLEELVTGEDGTATSGVLNEGTGYYIRELEGAPGFLADTETRHPFDIIENGVTIPITITNPRIVGGVRIVKDDGAGNPLGGVVIGVYKNGELVKELTTAADGTASSGPLYYGTDYELREISTVDGYELIDTPVPFSILEQDVILDIPLSNPMILGSVTVVKVDAADESPLAGAVFGLYNAQGQKIAEKAADETGRAVFEGLPKSAYYLKELVAPEGFVLSDELIPFSITGQGESVEIIVPNAKGYGTVIITKHGQSLSGGDNELLPGVVFEVYREATGQAVTELVTSEDGTVSAELPLGRYYLTEKSTVPGYQLLSVSVSFALTTEGAVVELSVQNQREAAPEGGKIRLLKQSETDETPLPGAVFGVYSAADDTKVAELVTGSDGTAISPALPETEAGYYLLELAAPAQYKALTDKIPVAVKNGETTDITVKNAPLDPAPENGTLEIVKNTDGGVKLPGAVFGVYRASDDVKVTELTTDRDGRVAYELPAGDYYLKELKCDGYILVTGKIPFRVKAGETTTETVTNKPLPSDTDGTLTIVKESSDGKKLAGAVFGVYRTADDVKVAELTTDSKGEAVYGLPAGDYYLKELRCDGYKLIDGKISFRIKQDETKEVAVTNEPLPAADMGRVLLLKKAAGTGRPLADAVFGVYKSFNDEKVCEITTDSRGEASVMLPLAGYYLKELKAPSGFLAETARIPFTVRSVDATVKIEVTNTQGRGSVRLVKTGTSNEKIAGAVFTLYAQDGTRIAELTTGKDGTALYELPIGSYYCVEKTAAVGYRLDTRRHGFEVQNGRTAELKIVNQPIEGAVEVYFRHADDSRELAPMQSLTGKLGTDYIKWMREKGYENMPITGYNLLRTDYPSSLVIIDGKLTVTLWYDDVPVPAVPGETTPGGITIPKTGTVPPVTPYLLSLLCWAVAAVCGIALLKTRQPKTAMASGLSVQPVSPVQPVGTATAKQRQNQNHGSKKKKKGRR